MTCPSLMDTLGASRRRRSQNPTDAKRDRAMKKKLRFTKAVAIAGYEYGMLQSRLKRKHKKATPHVEPEVPVEVTPQNGETPDAKAVAVVVPALVTKESDLKKLRRSLECIHSQSAMPDFVFLVDDCSPLPLREQLGDDFPEVTIIRSDRNEGPASARNKGLQAARAAGVAYVCMTDADCCPHSGWVESLVQHFETHPGHDIIGGVTQSQNANNVDLYHDTYGTLNGRILPDETLLYTPSCNMGVRLATVGVQFKTTFPEAAYEDIDFCLEARKLGAVLKHVESARVMHDYDASIKGLFRQFSRYGRSYRDMKKLHPTYVASLLESDYIQVKKRCAI